MPVIESLTPIPPDDALLAALRATPAPPAPPPPPPPEPLPLPPIKAFPPTPAIAISAGEFAYAPPPPVQPVLIALPSGFKLVAL